MQAQKLIIEQKVKKTWATPEVWLLDKGYGGIQGGGVRPYSHESGHGNHNHVVTLNGASGPAGLFSYDQYPQHS